MPMGEPRWSNTIPIGKPAIFGASAEKPEIFKKNHQKTGFGDVTKKRMPLFIVMETGCCKLDFVYIKTSSSCDSHA